MARGRMDERTTALFADAERSAERVVGQLRMAIALSLGAVFAIAVVTHAQRDDAVLAVQITAASATIVAYLALGALSYHLAVPHRFRPWMPWAPSSTLARAGGPRIRRATIQPGAAPLCHGTAGGRLGCHRRRRFRI